MKKRALRLCICLALSLVIVESGVLAKGCSLSSAFLFQKRLAYANLKRAQAANVSSVIFSAKAQIAYANNYLATCFDGTNVPWNIKQAFRKLIGTNWSCSSTGLKVTAKLLEFAEGNDISFSALGKIWGKTTIWLLEEEIYVSDQLKGDIGAIATVLAHEGCHAAFPKMKHVDVYIEELEVYNEIKKFSGGSYYTDMNEFNAYSSHDDLRRILQRHDIDPDETM